MNKTITILLLFLLIALDVQKGTLQKTLKFRDQQVLEMEKTLQNRNMKLSDLSEQLSTLQDENKRLKERLKEVQTRLDNMLELSATAYTSKCEGCSGITSSGHDVTNRVKVGGMRVVAVDPQVIPLGTVMIVHTKEESFKAIALDVGGEIKGNELDILVKTKTEAYDFGRQKVVVELGHKLDLNSLN